METPRYEDLFAYLEAVAATGRLKRTSVDLARSTLKRILEATDVTIDTVLDDLDVDEIKKQLEKLNLKPATADAYAARLRRVMKDSKAWANGEEPRGKQSPQATIDYPFQLRPDLRLTLTLPADLTPAEARRVAKFLESVALEPEEE